MRGCIFVEFIFRVSADRLNAQSNQHLGGDSMRTTLILLPLFLSATPALAQAAAPDEPAGPKALHVPHDLTDPAAMDHLAMKLEALSEALLNVPVGDVKAAVEGHPATAVEQRMTVGDVIRHHDPDFDRQVARQMAETGPKIRQGVKAIHEALPAMMHAINEAQQAVDRAAANMPDPTYPKR